MSDRRQILEQLKKTQENIAVGLGVIIGLTLSVYFFTYAMLVDKGLSGALWLEGISSVAMVLMLIYLRQISYMLARLWLGRRAELREALDSIRFEDLSSK